VKRPSAHHALGTCGRSPEHVNVLLPLVPNIRVRIEKMLPARAECLALLLRLLRLVRADVARLVEQLARVRNQVVESGFCVWTIQVDARGDGADACEEAFKQLVAGEALGEDARAVERLVQALLQHGVINERVQICTLVHVRGGVKGLVQLLFNEVEDGQNCIVVFVVLLRALADLKR
jgi:hypothetical protein